MKPRCAAASVSVVDNASLQICTSSMPLARCNFTSDFRASIPVRQTEEMVSEARTRRPRRRQGSISPCVPKKKKKKKMILNYRYRLKMPQVGIYLYQQTGKKPGLLDWSISGLGTPKQRDDVSMKGSKGANCCRQMSQSEIGG